MHTFLDLNWGGGLGLPTEQGTLTVLRTGERGEGGGKWEEVETFNKKKKTNKVSKCLKQNVRANWIFLKIVEKDKLIRLDFF